MAVVLALPRLYDAVKATFDADATALAAAQDPPVDPVFVPQVFGWREPPKRTGRMRVVWVPGDDGTGALGDLGPPRQPGREPRPLATLHELATVYLEAVDLTAPENERVQYQAARELFDAWVRAVHLAAHGTVSIRSTSWVIDKSVRRYGATLRVLLAIEAMVPDAPLELVTDAAAEIETELLDVTETMSTEAA